jgi:hypothetical protein
MYEGDDLDGTPRCTIDDKVVASRPKENRKAGEVLARVPHAGKLRQFFEGLEKLPEQTLRGIDAVVGM